MNLLIGFYIVLLNEGIIYDKIILDLKRMVIYMKRHARIKAMQVLYSIDFNKITFDEAKSLVMDEENDELALELAKNCFDRISEIDKIISDSLERYTIDRLNLVDKAIVRLAVYEMLTGEHPAIVIDEALEITKIYSDQGDHKAASFNNKLLDTISKKIK